MATAFISALTNRAVHHDVALTGEITLRGRILPVGGLKEKSMAAHRAGIKTIIVPKRNQKDMVDIPKKIQRDLKFIFVDRMDDVLPLVLASEPTKPR
jgi:ATP-dependent Lon protease